MTSQGEGEQPTREEQALDAVVREARLRTNTGFVRPSDDDIWAYVSGTATDRQTETVRAALMTSEAFRHEILEISEDAEEVARPEVEALFAQARAGKVPSFEKLLAGTGRSRRVQQRGVAAALGRFFDHFWGLAQKPAFAYAFMLALMAYPTYHWLAGGEGKAPSLPSEGAVLPSQLLFVWPEPNITLRGQRERLPEIVLDPTAEIIDVTVWAPAFPPIQPGLADGPRFTATISDDRGVIWSTEDFRGLVTIEGQYAFRFTLITKALRPGVITIRVEPIHPGTSREEPPIVARFRVAANE